MHTVPIAIILPDTLIDIIESDAFAPAHITDLDILPKLLQSFGSHTASVVLHINIQQSKPIRNPAVNGKPDHSTLLFLLHSMQNRIFHHRLQKQRQNLIF